MCRSANIMVGLVCAVALFCAGVAGAEVAYRFERLWPMLAQPWYFSSPAGLACDESSNVYVADSFNGRVQKYTAQGQFITLWNGSDGLNPAFDTPQDIAVDVDGNVYVLDSAACRVRVFAPTGAVLHAWGEPGGGAGQFEHPMGLALDRTGRVYVADTGNNRVQVFESDGVFLTAWDGVGLGYALNQPGDLAFDGRGYAYVADTGNDRVVCLNSTGALLDAWGTTGTAEGDFRHPSRILVDSDGRVYVSDMDNFRIQRFSAEGAFQLAWGVEGHDAEEFARPDGITLDSFGRILVSDSGCHDRVQVFTEDGVFVAAWGSQRGGPNEYNGPTDIAVDASGEEAFIYVTDFGNSRIQKLNEAGRFVEYWGPVAGETGHCQSPYSITLNTLHQIAYAYDLYDHKIRKYNLADGGSIGEWDSLASSFVGLAATAEYLYMADSLNNTVRIFDNWGEVKYEWGESGSEDGQFSFPYDVAVSETGEIYVADSGNHCIQVFDEAGSFVRKWGTSGTGPGEFNFPIAIAFTPEGSVLVTDSDNHRIQQFSPGGVFQAQFGTFGAAPGQFNKPQGLAALDGGRVLVADTLNNRLQQFRAMEQAERARAVIVAGGGPIPGNTLWDATRLCANFAYRALLFSGYTKEDIYYLSTDRGVDLDGDGLPNDVDADCTLDDLEYALTGWPAEGEADTDLLTTYLVDHGGENTFRMSATEILEANTFAQWLNAGRHYVSGEMVFINDSCHSGSFIRAAEKSVETPGTVMIASAASGESAYFMGTGTASFSSVFWMDILNGLDVDSAFNFADATMQAIYERQHPQLEGDGDGIPNEPEDHAAAAGLYLGMSGTGGVERPVIGQVLAPAELESTTSASITAWDIQGPDPVAETWAVIRPPETGVSEIGSPVLWLPTVPLDPVGEGVYRGEYGAFNAAGAYQVAVYARDAAGRTSAPVQRTITVANPQRRRAILVVGGGMDDPFWPAVSNNALMAWQALKFQGYAEEDIRFYSTEAIVTAVNDLPTVENVQLAITEWAAANTLDLAVYLTGNGGPGLLDLAPGEILTATALKLWLDTLQAAMPGRVSVICDFCASGSFLPSLAGMTDGRRIVLSGSGRESAPAFSGEGDASFSRFFWRQVLSGANLRGAFLHAANALQFADGEYAPCLDDTGDGQYTPGVDGHFAASTTLGRGIRIAADPPVILEVCPAQVIGTGKSETETTAQLWANPITSTAPLNRVFAVVYPPGQDPRDCGVTNSGGDMLPMTQDPSGLYGVTDDGFLERGVYQVLIYAEDVSGEVSSPARTSVEQQNSTVIPDHYEPDDTPGEASWIGIGGEAQHHNFSRSGDEDWALFFAEVNDLIVVETRHLGPAAATRLEIYRPGEPPELLAWDEYSNPEEVGAALLQWRADAEGFYLVRVTCIPPEAYGADTFYDLIISSVLGLTLPGTLAVHVEDGGQQVLDSVKLTLTGFGGLSSVTDNQGDTLFPTLPANRNYSVQAEKEGYQSATQSAYVTPGQTAVVSFVLQGIFQEEGEGEGEGEGEIPVEGEGEFSEGEGEGEPLEEGEGEVVAEGEGELPVEGEDEGESCGCNCQNSGKRILPLRRFLGDMVLIGLCIIVLVAYGQITGKP